MYVDQGDRRNRPTGQKRDEQMSHDQIMQDNIANMSRDQIASAIKTLYSVYIPNMVATMQHPQAIVVYTDRLADLLVEATARRVANNKAVRV